MFEMEFFGENKKITNSEMLKAAYFYLEILIPPKEIKPLSIEISYEKPDAIRNGHGYVLNIDHPNDRSKKKFFIWLRPSRSRKKQFITLAHECVHIKQHVCGEYPYHNDFRNSEIVNAFCSYWDDPREIEAFGKEFGLYRRYEESLKQPH